jgi:hypothetical protein
MITPGIAESMRSSKLKVHFGAAADDTAHDVNHGVLAACLLVKYIRYHSFWHHLLLQVAVKVIEHSGDTSAVVENEVKLMMQVD